MPSFTLKKALSRHQELAQSRPPPFFHLVSSHFYLDFGSVVERRAEDTVESFTNLNGLGRGRSERNFEETSAMLDKFDDFRAIPNAVHAKTATWIRHRNNLAQIHKLPTELLHLIFRLVLFASSGRRRRNFVARLNSLRSVSWMWRDLIDHTPPFWAQLSSQDHIDFVSEALQLKYVARMEKEASSSPFLEKAFVHLDRWEYVVLQEPHGVLVEKYFSSPAPRLKGMVLSTQIGAVVYGPRPPPLLFGGDLADLDEFRAIRWKQMYWTDIHCHKLSVLEIEDYFSLDMETLFGIIAENLDLRILRIHFITFSEYIHLGERQPLVLRRLTDFTFTNIAEMVGEDRRQVRDIPVMRMLQRVQFPACTSFNIGIGLNSSSDAMQKDFFRLIPSPVEIFKRRGETQGFSSKPPTARITFWDGDFQCEAFGNAKSNLKKELGADWTETRLDLQLRYWVDDDQYKIDDIFKFEDLGHVVELEVMGSGLVGKPGVGLGLAKRLASPLTSSTGAVIGPFVRLRTLRLDHCAVTGKEMLSMVKDRFARITNPSSKGRKGGKKKQTDVPAEGGITIILGKGMQRFSDSIARGIRSAPGVKDLRWYSDPPITDHDGSSSSEESDWYPHYSEDDEDTSSEEDVTEEWSDE